MAAPHLLLVQPQRSIEQMRREPRDLGHVVIERVLDELAAIGE